MRNLPFLMNSNQGNEAVIVWSRRKRYYPCHKKGAIEIIKVCIAPRCGIYDISRLQSWMIGLITDSSPLDVINFREGREIIHLGKVEFLEEFASCCKTRKKFYRRWIIRFYPDISIAHLLIRKGKNHILDKSVIEEKSLFV